MLKWRSFMNIIETESAPYMEPLTSERKLLECQCAGTTLGNLLLNRVDALTSSLIIGIVDVFWPSDAILERLAASERDILVRSDKGCVLAWASVSGEIPENSLEISPDDESLHILYPWDLLKINEEVVGKLTENSIKGIVREGVVIDGYVEIGEGSVLLPGVYIEGNVIIGKNCKIGPNCYIRGSSFIGNGCHIGQAVEIKNSLLMDSVSAGHLSYVGDSIIGENSNLGAGTITANFRHDGKNHRSEVGGELIDTGRRKFGSILGNDVHTGIHTSIYPGRKIWPYMSTRPGDIVQRDIK
jgi:bifunctional UDP-N-acetylglucosamine pyrophosphorylase/glucosamine-1-phosphate N-acetyltransferase